MATVDRDKGSDLEQWKMGDGIKKSKSSNSNEKKGETTKRNIVPFPHFRASRKTRKDSLCPH
jgi:hypothetical protein